MKKNNKINKIIILSAIALIFIVSLVIFILNFTKDSSSFSLLEKGWINNHKNTVIDVSVYNDVPIYGQDGEGVIFSYLQEFTNTYGIEFNKVSYLKSLDTTLKDTAFRVLDYGVELTDNDILLYKDYYVIVGKDTKAITRIDDLRDANLGVIDKDASSIRYFLNDGKNIKFTIGKDVDELLKLLTSDSVTYIVLPGNLYLDVILKNDLAIVYHLDEVYKKYVLTVNKDNTFKSIMNKYNMIYQNDFSKEKYRDFFLNTFFKYKELSEAERRTYNSATYIYGYTTNMPFENNVNKEFVGIISNYLSDFEDLVNVDFKMVWYPNNTALKQALSRGEVDLVFGDFNTDGVNVDRFTTNGMFRPMYFILSKDNIAINSIRSLKGQVLYTVAGTYIHDFLLANSITAMAYDDTDKLLRSINNDSLIIVNKETYEYYKDNKFKNYKIVYQDYLDNDYGFVVRDVNKNSTFYELFNYFVSSIDYKTVRYSYNTNYIVNSKNQVSNMLKYTAIIVGVTLLLLLIMYIILKINNRKKSLNKEDKLKFIDVMTSLKNRNYLNYNIKKWEDNVIYPQAIVIIDLNNIKYINDNYGHEEGDEVIKKAASILIVNQYENTDIIRTDGNEFLIYMVGYDEKKVIEYTRMLSKELKELPHEFGATLGYSMILNDVKTIDDAINEATLSMRQAKEKL